MIKCNVEIYFQSMKCLNIFYYIHVQIIQKMKKYVSKQDVQNGLVDPNKPLNEQKQYLDKIQKEDKEKPHHRPKPDYHPKRERQNRPKYNWNRRDVTQETPIPEAPKKQIPKPDKEKFHNDLNGLKKKLESLNEQKSKLFEDMKSTMRNTSDNKKNTRNVKTKYSGLLGQKHTLRKNLHQEIKMLEERREEIEKQLNQVKVKVGSLRKPENFEDCSLEELQRRLEKTEHRLTTAELTKKQQNQINMRIQQIKRAMQKSRSETEVNSDISKLQDQNQILYKQLKQVRATINEKYGLLKQVKAEIGKLNEQLDQQKVEPEDTRTPEEIKADFDKKIGGVNDKKDAIKKQIDKLKQAYEKKLDQYDDYSDLIAYIKMVKEQKQRIASRKLEQERIKKEKEEAEKKRQKEYEQRQKRRQEKLKKQEERRKQVQQRKQQLQKERQQFINRNPHHQKIDICRVLLDYCESIKPENAVKNLVKRQQKLAQPILELKPADSKDWEKQLKKGAQVIVSKKLRQEEEAPKKVVKQKKKKEAPEPSNSAFTHTIETSQMFDQVNLLPPLTVNEIDDTIKQINERIELFNKPSEQQIKAFKERAEKQFDSIHGFDEQRGKKSYKERSGEEKEHVEQEKPKEVKEKSKRVEKNEVVATEKDFPGLN